MSVSAHRKPILAVVIGPFSKHVDKHGPDAVERFFNPLNSFEEVHIVALGDDFDYSQQRFGSLYVHPVRSVATGPRLRFLNNFYLMTAGILRLRRIAKDHGIDLIAQIASTPLKFGFPAVVVAKTAGTPSVITLCNDYRSLGDQTYPPLVRWGSEFLWRFLFRNCTRVRSKSPYISEFAYAHGVLPDKVRVIPNKEIVERFQTRPDDDELERVARDLGVVDLVDGSIVILTVARLREAKNLERQLRAFALACNRLPNLAYLIVGQGLLRSRLGSLVQQLGVSDRVRFLDAFYSHDELRSIYRLSDVLLFATLYEGQPRVVIEAMLSDLPIVCANYGEVCGIVEDGIDGIWVDPLDVRSISQALVRLGSDGIVRTRMSRHAGFDAQRFSLERVSEQEADFYLSVISDGASVEDSVTEDPTVTLSR